MVRLDSILTHLMEAILPPIGSSVLGNRSLGTGYVPLSYKVKMNKLVIIIWYIDPSHPSLPLLSLWHGRH